MSSDQEIIDISSDSFSSDLDIGTNVIDFTRYGSSSDTEESVASTGTVRSKRSASSNESDSTESGYEVCCACKDGGRLILCDGCGTSFHPLCHFPLILDIPKGSWYCAVCSQQSTSGRELSPRQRRKGASSSSLSPVHSTSLSENKFCSVFEKCEEAVVSRNAAEFSSTFISDESSTSSDDDDADDDESIVDDDDELKRVFEVEEPKACFYCKRLFPEEDLISCDYCTRVFHEDCLLPLPGRELDEKWMCPIHLRSIAQRYMKLGHSRIKCLANYVSKRASDFSVSVLRDFMFSQSAEKKQSEPFFYVAEDEMETINSCEAKQSDDETCYNTVSSWCCDVFRLLELVRMQEEEEEEGEVEEKLKQPIPFADSSFEDSKDTDGEIVKIIDRYTIVKALLGKLKGPHSFQLTSVSVDLRGYDSSLPVLATLKLWYSCIEIIVQQTWLSLGTIEGAVNLTISESHLNLSRYCSCSRLSPVHAILFLDQERSQFFIFCQSIYGIIVDDVSYGFKLQDDDGVNYSSDGSNKRFFDLMVKKIAQFECNCADKFVSDEFVDEPVALRSGSRVRIGCLEFTFWPSWKYGECQLVIHTTLPKMEMDALLEVVNKLQDVLYAAGCNCIELPQIVVVGAQSSGKSSIIESIVGKDFLPRGPGIVTRRPLILQLINSTKEGKDDCPDKVQFYHCGDRIFYDFDEVRAEIEDETERELGRNKAISHLPIVMKFFSTRVVNLTLVDLPGITKIPVGDQPSDIESKLYEIIMSYIRSDSSIILAITAANQDFATSDSLKMARQVDPDGERTLAVVTKLDLMDLGTDATDLLLGKVVPVKLGIIGVVNRSNRDTVNRKSITAALEDEAEFLKRNYPTLWECNGTPYLTKTLNRLLMRHIKDKLPQLRAQILLKISEHQQMLDLYGKPVIDKPQTLLQVITRFCSSYVATVEGTARNIETSELCGGARICYIFHETFRKTLERINPTKNLKKVDILTAIRNATGPRPVLFIPEIAFELLVKRQIVKLLEPSLRCVDLVHKEMQRMVYHCEADIRREMGRFPKLCERIIEVVSSVLCSRIPVTNQMVESLISIQLAYINTKHPDFDGATLESLLYCQTEEDSCDEQVTYPTVPEDHRTRKSSAEQMNTASIESLPDSVDKKENTDLALSSLPNQRSGSDGAAYGYSFGQTNLAVRATNALSDFFLRRKEDKEEPSNKPKQPVVERCHLSSREQRDCKIIEKLVQSYFTIVRKQVQDTIPKTIMHFLVNHVKDNLQSELVQQLYHAELLDELLEESEHTKKQREGIMRTLDSLQKASQIIAEVRELRLS
ncbi:hypothetical protein M514_06573 [Trichuris suis]|uniref:Uncharacterized protein n=1 Tax=Trichuris suis TaxID=68888 RepID=A0A085N6V8_9BILA|nr:hypothetical protein M514_06573 [Trichuris suis]